mgnify:CR=1 FL=1
MKPGKRVKLPKEKQQELIERAKAITGLSWSKFAARLNLNAHYLGHELRNGERTLPFSLYKRLCTIISENFDDHIVDIIPSNWGQRKGGRKSGGGKPRETQILTQKSNELAEFIGVMLGDGHLGKSHKTGHYTVKICGGIDDLKYLTEFIVPLFSKLFRKRLRMFRCKGSKAVMFYAYDKDVVCTLVHYGLQPGNKKNNDVRIPEWVFSDDGYLKACVRGIFDTDGTVFPKSTNPKIPQLELASKIIGIQETFRQGLQQLGFKPSTWSKGASPKCGLYAKNQIIKYVKEVGFHNPKHRRRYDAILR